MRILFMSHYYPPEVNAPANRVSQLARAWVQDGHEVTVLTGFPNHPTGIVPPSYRGRPYIRREDDQGVTVVRTPIYASANRGIVKRGLNYASYAISASLLGPVLTPSPDVLVATSPQFLTAIAGYCVARIKRTVFVLEVRDLWPQSIVEIGAMREGNLVVRMMRTAERFLYRRAARVVVVAPSFVNHITKHGVPRDRLAVVMNGVDIRLFRPGPHENEIRARLGLQDKFVLAYIGTHGLAHGLDTLLDAAVMLRRDDRFRFLLVGDGAEKDALRRRAARDGLRNVVFVDQQPHEAIPAYMHAADVGVVMLRALDLFSTVIPSKMFEFMATARPIVIGVDGEARRIVEEAEAGVFVPPERAAALATAAQKLAADREALDRAGDNGRRYVEAHLAIPALARRYAEILADAAAPPASAGRSVARERGEEQVA